MKRLLLVLLFLSSFLWPEEQHTVEVYGKKIPFLFDSKRDVLIIKGELLKQPLQDLSALDELPDETAEKIRKLTPVAIELLAPETRVSAFTEIERGFSEAEALAESKRCLACTTGALADEEKCAACLTCVRICPFNVATVEKTAVMPEEKCQACGLCAAACPAPGS